MKENNISPVSEQNSIDKIWMPIFKILDDLGCREMSHNEILKSLKEKFTSDNYSWSQIAIIRYETYIGKRVLGKLVKGFQIGVRKTFQLTKEEAWELVASPEGRKIWLSLDGYFNWKVGETFKTATGDEGIITVFVPEVNIRIKWKKSGWDTYSIIQVRVNPKNDKSEIFFHNENLPNKEAREEMKTRWKKALEKLEQLAKLIIFI